MSLPPDLRIEDEKFVELISQTNFLQRLLYLPYVVFTCAVIGILYGLVFSLPIIWMPFPMVRGLSLVIIVSAIIFCASINSGIYVYSKDGISPLLLQLIAVIEIVALAIVPVQFPYPYSIISLLLGEFIVQFVFIFVIGATLFSGVFWFAYKMVEQSTERVSKLSHMDLTKPYGDEDTNSYTEMIAALSEFFWDLGKVMKKRTSRNIFMQWYVKLWALSAGCSAILFMPILAYGALIYYIGKLNITIQKWGLSRILVLTASHTKQKAHPNDTP